jgi:hypothetical protein
METCYIEHAATLPKVILETVFGGKRGRREERRGGKTAWHLIS